LNALQQAINACIAADEDPGTNWEEDSAVVYQTTDTLDGTANQVRIIYGNEKEKERWEAIYIESKEELASYA
jgi:hypothetical protein